MNNVPLSDTLYRRASEAALTNKVSLEVFVAEAVELYLGGNADGDAHLFTPEVLAAIDRGAHQAKEGLGLTMDQVDEHFAERRKAWQTEQAG